MLVEVKVDGDGACRTLKEVEVGGHVRTGICCWGWGGGGEEGEGEEGGDGWEGELHGGCLMVFEVDCGLADVCFC